jgi:hypothetical protein
MIWIQLIDNLLNLDDHVVTAMDSICLGQY